MTTRTAPDLERTVDRGPALYPWLSPGLAVLGMGTAAVALLGPLVFGIIEYPVSVAAANQIRGGDVAGLLLAAPLCWYSAWLIARGRTAGATLALGPAFYAMYVSTQLAVGGDPSRYDGNTHLFFPLFVAVFVLAGTVAMASVRVVMPIAEVGPRVRWAFGWFALFVATFLAVGLHLPGLVDSWAPEPSGTELASDPVVFWLVKFMDLGIVVPLLVAVGIGMLRRKPRAEAARFAASGWVALLGASVAGMAIVMEMTDDPAASPINTVAFSLFAVVGVWFAIAIHRPLIMGPNGMRRRAGTGAADGEADPVD
jgi:hypothetical protein